MCAALASIEGTVAPGYEPVREAFAANFRKAGDAELGAALCAYRNDCCVVDLWGGFRDAAGSAPWTADTLVSVWSTTKGVTALVIALLVERGLLRYEQRVAEIWPEFAAAGKQDVTVAQVMAHRAGLPGFDEPTTLRDLYDGPASCAKLARQRPVFEPGSCSSYHTITYGLLAGELVRRVTGQSLGTYLARALATPLQAAFFVGTPPEHDGEIAELVAPGAAPPMPANLPPAVRMAVENPALDVATAQTRAWRGAELPAVNGHGSARGVARLFAVIACGGEAFGRQVLSPHTIGKLMHVYGSGPDLLLGYDPHWCMGLHRNTHGLYGTNPLAVGHSGWGGSFGCADPERKLSIGYVCNRMGAEMVGGERARALARSFDRL